MSRWRLALILFFMAAPLLAIGVIASWAIWKTGWMLWAVAVLPIGWGLAWILAKRWRTSMIPLIADRADAPEFSTARDREAWTLVEAFHTDVRDIPSDKLLEPKYYLEAADRLAKKIGDHYKPSARQPLFELTVIEVLTAAQLALEDVEEWISTNVPFSHMVTISQWKTLPTLGKWSSRISRVYQIAATAWDPTTAPRRWLSDQLWRETQTNLLQALYVEYCRRVGFYVIEMHSGRLRGGTEPYRKARRRLQQLKKRSRRSSESQPPVDGDPVDDAADLEPVDVTIAVVGQVKAGKSSLINALLGEQHAAVDVLPLTREIKRYRLNLPDRQEQLSLLDTVGYGEADAGVLDTAETQEAVRQADLVLLVMNATSPARDPDLKQLESLAKWFEGRPKYSPPPMMGVLTHIDGLSPAARWEPPYDWTEPTSPKEQSIAGAVEYVDEILGAHLTGVVPVCTDVNNRRVYGIEEWLLPAMSVLLDDARTVSLIRGLHHELNKGRIRKTFKQLKRVGARVLKSNLEALLSSRGK